MAFANQQQRPSRQLPNDHHGRRHYRPAPATRASTATGVGVGVGVRVGVGYGTLAGHCHRRPPATGGSVTSSGNSTASVSNSGNAYVATTVMQGQQQGDPAAGGVRRRAGGASSTSSSSSSGGNTLAASTGSMTVSGRATPTKPQARKPGASAWAAPLAASNGTMGSTSAGAQGVTIGLSVGTTWTDPATPVTTPSPSRPWVTSAPRARLCQQPASAKAYEAAGTPCPKRPRATEGSCGWCAARGGLLQLRAVDRRPTGLHRSNLEALSKRPTSALTISRAW